MKADIYSSFVRKVMKETMLGDENVVVSPYSILVLIAMAASATNGNTRSELLNAISDEFSEAEFSELVVELQKMCSGKAGVSSANAIAVKENISESISADFKEQFSREFDGEIFNSVDIINDINSWVKEKTNGMIDNIVNDSMKHMLLSIMNAVAFDAEWRSQYEDDDVIDDGEFTNIDGSVSNVTMLDSCENIYLEDPFFEGFAKPYKNGYTFVGLLPKKKKSKSFLLRGFEQIDFMSLIKNSVHTKVYTQIPEFKSELSMSLNDTFKKWGINELFTGAADFTPLSSENLMVEGVLHKAVIDVNRKGTKAAAVTIAYAVAGCAPRFDYKVIYLDRPFVYAIVDNELMQPIFTGVVNRL